MIPDWQLPRGTDRGLWDYIHSETLARNYDDVLADSSLLQIDLRFAQQHFPDRGRLIDLGCGTGRLMIPFSKLGYWCLGVDLSETMLQVFAEKAKKADVPARAIKANLVELDAIIEGTFDYAACLFSTLGMIRGQDHRRQMLSQIARILRPSGKLILHVHNRWFRGGLGQGRRGAEPGDRRMPQHYAGAELTLHHFTRSEILAELHLAGFKPIEVLPITTSADGRLRWPWFLGSLRSYGYLVAAVK